MSSESRILEELKASEPLRDQRIPLTILDVLAKRQRQRQKACSGPVLVKELRALTPPVHTDVPKLRTHVSRLRKFCDLYFRTDGRKHPIAVDIRRGDYALRFVDNPHHVRGVDDKEKTAIDQFWAPYFSGDKPTLVVISQPLFLSDGDSLFLGPGSSERETGRRGKSVKPDTRFLLAGEVRAFWNLGKEFLSRGVQVELESHREFVQHARHRNVVVIGGADRSDHLDAMRIGSGYRLTSAGVVDTGKAGRAALRKDDPDADGAGPIGHVLVTRRPNVGSGSAGILTMIGANEAAAAESVAEYLTSEGQLQELLLRTGWKDTLPEVFELLFRAELFFARDGSTDAGKPELIEHRAYPARKDTEQAGPVKKEKAS